MLQGSSLYPKRTSYWVESNLPTETKELNPIMQKYTQPINTQESFLQAIRGRSFIIGSMTTENGLSFAKNPSSHYSRDSAKAEAKRLALANPGKLFTYVELSGGELIPNTAISV